MRKVGLLLCGFFAVIATPAFADLTYTQGSGTTIFDFTCFVSKHCTAGVVVNSSGTEIFTAAAPAQVTGANGSFPVTGTITANAGTGNFTVVNGGTFAVQATLQASGTTAIGKVDPNTIATWGLAAGSTTTGTAAPTNAGLVSGQFNSPAPTVTNGNVIPLQTDASGFLKVNISAGGGSGGTAISDFGAFTQGNPGAGTNFTPIGGYYNSAPTALTSGNGGAVAMTTARSMHVLEDNSSAILTAAQAATGSTGSTTPTSGVLIGCNASNATTPVSVSNGQLAGVLCDLTEKVIVQPFAIKELQATGYVASTDGAAHTILTAGTGSNKTYVTDWECYNTSTTTITVAFNDTKTTTIIVPAGGGNNKHLAVPIVTAATTAFQMTSSSGQTTVACAAQGFYGL